MLLEGLRIRKPPAEFQDVCRKTFCAVRAALQLEDFNVAGLTRRKFVVRRGFHYESWLSFPRSGFLQCLHLPLIFGWLLFGGLVSWWIILTSLIFPSVSLNIYHFMFENKHA